jgi:predicted GH43/DUF377 family glycosyl hydrolase
LTTGFKLHRLGTLMEPEPGNALESDGVLNPAAARGPDGQLYLFPRMVAKGNYSRIGIARVLFDSKGDPTGVERMGIALEPEADYEKRPEGAGGCEDPRITYLEPLGHYVMSYVAFSPRGPRIALARSKDLLKWERLGLATFEPYDGIEFDGIDNKDSTIFPHAVLNPNGIPSVALLHRPLFPGTRPEEKARRHEHTVRDIQRESIWISYREISPNSPEPPQLVRFTSHERLAAPVEQWEHLKIGVGTPPILTRLGWLVIYHGVTELARPEGSHLHPMCYSAGAMVLYKERPEHIRHRSKAPILRPELPEEKVGLIADVVFPTGIDRRDDIGDPERFDVYYGMADDKIGVATLRLPEHLTPRDELVPDNREPVLDPHSPAFGH